MTYKLPDHLRYLEGKLAALLLLLLILGLVCAYIEWQRYRLGSRLDKLSPSERERLAREDPEVRFSRPAFQGKSYIVTMLAGQAFVNVPLVLMIIAPLSLVQRWLEPNDYPLENFLALIAGFLLAWAWWSVTVSIWRYWAIRYRNMSAEEVQWRGEGGMLLWDQSSRLSKTALYVWLSDRQRK